MRWWPTDTDVARRRLLVGAFYDALPVFGEVLTPAASRWRSGLPLAETVRE